LFAHEPEPTEENLKGLCNVVKDNSADIGFAQDPDGDRLAIVDETGRYIGEEYTLALAAKFVFGKKKGKAATNLSTSRMIDDIARGADCEVIRTPVGEANVASAMLENDCIIGGEGNGGVIDLRVGPIRDSLVGIALILHLMAETGKTVGELVGQIGGYYMLKEKFAADHKQVQRILYLAKERFAEVKVDIQDGYRFDFDDGWVHLRASNTEPIMRVIIEAKDERAARKYIEAIMRIRNMVLGVAS
jgi:phosphomannomutase